MPMPLKTSSDADDVLFMALLRANSVGMLRSSAADVFASLRDGEYATSKYTRH